MCGGEDHLGIEAIAVGDEAKAPVGLGDVDIRQVSKLAKVLLELFFCHSRVVGKIADKELARKVRRALKDKERKRSMLKNVQILNFLSPFLGTSVHSVFP